jgi:restriction system protein
VEERERKYYRLILGKGHSFAETCFAENFVGIDLFADEDLTNKFPADLKEFNRNYIPKFLEQNPDKTKVAAGQACGRLYTLCKEFEDNDIVVCPDGRGNYRFGRIKGEYYYKHQGVLPHRRKVEWLSLTVPKNQFSEEFQSSIGSIRTLVQISKYKDDLERLLRGAQPREIFSTDKSIEAPSIFAMEKHLEDFLIKNWATTILSQSYKIVEADGEKIGQQFATDTGPIDILAISKDESEFLVIELKRGRASDAVVGQIQRYMGYIADVYAEPHQTVRGCIIAFEDDQKIRRALKVATSIDFYKYEIDFKLAKIE